jgi:hypothetical protein
MRLALQRWQGSKSFQLPANLRSSSALPAGEPDVGFGLTGAANPTCVTGSTESLA